MGEVKALRHGDNGDWVGWEDHCAGVAALQKALGATRRELERWKRGALIEGDYVCANGDVVGDPWRERDDAIALRDRAIAGNQALNAEIRKRDERIAALQERVDRLRDDNAIQLAALRYAGLAACGEGRHHGQHE